MSNNKGFFNFDTSLDHNFMEGQEEPADDTDYDKLNAETFGDDLLNWEENNDKLCPEIEKESVDFENNQLCERVASVILEDESEDQQRPTRTVPGASQTPGQIWDRNNGSKVFTVEEIEAEMRKGAVTNKDIGATSDQGAANENPGVPNNVQNKPAQNRPYKSNIQDLYQPRYPAGHYNNSRNFSQQQHHPVGFLQRPHPPQRLQGPGNHQGFLDARFVQRHFMFPPRFMNHHMTPHRGINPHPNDRVHFFNQQQPRVFNGPPSTSSQHVDEYAGLMSVQEKQWLQSIQAMQLNGNQPLLDDYYFSMFNHNKQGTTGRKINNFNVKNSKPTSTYTPQQFENSLGKLQIGSVTAPRKIIDMDVVESPNIDAQTKPDKKSKQLLMEIEETYNMVLQLEEHCNPIFNTPGIAKEKLKVSELQEKVTNVLTSENKLVNFMAVRKGRKLVSRCLPVLENTAPIIQILLMDLVLISRRDIDQTLLVFNPYVRTYLDTVMLCTLVEINKRFPTSFLFSTKFVTSVTAKMVERAWGVFDSCEDEKIQEDWKIELVKMAQSTDNWVDGNRPVIAIDRDLLRQHLSLIASKVDPTEMRQLVRALGNTPRAIE